MIDVGGAQMSAEEAKRYATEASKLGKKYGAGTHEWAQAMASNNPYDPPLTILGKVYPGTQYIAWNTAAENAAQLYQVITYKESAESANTQLANGFIKVLEKAAQMIGD